MTDSHRHIVREIYSEVLFELAKELDMLDAVTEDLAAVIGILRTQPEFAAVMTSQTIRADQKAQTIRRVFEGKIADLTLDFLTVLARRNRMAFLAAVSDRYESLVDTYRGYSLVEVTMAAGPDDEQIARLKHDLSDAINAHVKLQVQVDPKIVGGIIIKKGETLIDNSVTGALQQAVTAVVERSRDRFNEV